MQRKYSSNSDEDEFKKRRKCIVVRQSNEVSTNQIHPTANNTESTENDDEYEYEYEKERENILNRKYNFNSKKEVASIVSIELLNNNKIYIKYNQDWTVKDLIYAILNHKEFLKLYNNSSISLNPQIFLNHFDLELLCIQQIKEIKERKCDYTMCLRYLFNKSLLSSNKNPFFLLIDNKNKVFLDMKTHNKVKINYEEYYLYDYYLPRVNSYYFLLHNPDFSNYFQENKETIIDIKPLETNPLVWETNEWFSYNSETLDFLAKLKEQKLDVIQKLKIDSEGNLYSQDTVFEIGLDENEYKSFLVEVIINSALSTKLPCKLSTTGEDLLVSANKKLSTMKKDSLFDISKKILKVKDKSDYIFDMDKSVGYLVYIIRSLKEGSNIKLEVIENPFLKEKEIKTKSEKQEGLLTNMMKMKNKKEIKLKDNSILLTTVNKNNSKEELRDLIFNLSKGKDSYTDKLNNILNILEICKDEIINQDKFTEKTIFKRAEPEKKELFSKLFGSKKNDPKIKSLVMINDDIKGNNINDNEKREVNILKSFNNDLDKIVNSINEKNQLSQQVKDEKPSKNNVENANIVNNKIQLSKQGLSQLIYENLLNKSIDIDTLNYPLKIKIQEIKLSNLLLIKDFIEKDPNEPIVLVVNFQLYLGQKQLTEKKNFVIKSGIFFDFSEISIRIKKKLTFKDLFYSQLHVFTSLIIEVYYVNSSLNLKKLIGWGNYKLFDHKNALKTGMNEIYLKDEDYNENSYFKWSSNYNPTILNTNVVYLELCTFKNMVKKYDNKGKKSKQDLTSIKIKESDIKIINDILLKSPFEQLKDSEKSVLWSNLVGIVNQPELLPRFFECVNFKNSEQVKDLCFILRNASFLSPLKAIQLFTGEFLHEEIRSYAIKCISKASHIDICDYLSQLIQGLKFEQNHYSKLAIYLIEKAVQYPTTIGHNLFWGLRCEMHNPEYQQRFGLILEGFLSKTEKQFLNYLENEIWLIDELLKIADIPFEKKFKDKSKKPEMIESYRYALSELSNRFCGKEIPIPINFNIRVKRIKSEKCKIMNSKKKPLWIVFETSNGDEISVMFKKGDDLRQDILTLQLFKVMQNIWFDNGVKLKMSIYSVVSTGYFQGMLEMVKSSETLATIHKQYGGATAAFSRENLLKWFEKNVTLSENEYKTNFKLSCVAYCIATFVLGIGDRHNDNIMVKTNGELFHIDFGHFLGHFKYKLGIKRERAPFVFTKEFKKVLGGKKNDMYIDFRKLCIDSYKIIRKNVNVLVSILRLMQKSEIPELTSTSINFLEQSLCLNIKEEDKVDEFLNSQFNDALTSLSTKLMFAIHVMAN